MPPLIGYLSDQLLEPKSIWILSTCTIKDLTAVGYIQAPMDGATRE